MALHRKFKPVARRGAHRRAVQQLDMNGPAMTSEGMPCITFPINAPRFRLSIKRMALGLLDLVQASLELSAGDLKDTMSAANPGQPWPTLGHLLLIANKESSTRMESILPDESPKCTKSCTATSFETPRPSNAGLEAEEQKTNIATPGFDPGSSGL